MKQLHYTLVVLLLLAMSGCSEQKQNSAKRESKAQSQQTASASLPQPQQEQSVKIETHAPKEKKKLLPNATTMSQKMLQTVQQPKKEEPVDAAKLYQACAGCHGADGKNAALGKSQPIAGWSKESVVQALKAYKAGSRNLYGMGAVMKGQAGKLSDAQMEALGAYISKL